MAGSVQASAYAATTDIRLSSFIHWATLSSCACASEREREREKEKGGGGGKTGETDALITEVQYSSQ